MNWRKWCEYDGVNYVGQNNEAKMKVSRGEGAVQQMSRVVMF